MTGVTDVSTERTSPTVSVVLPTYNRADSLPEAIDSVVDQTYEDFELIVVDDGSTDGTESIVEDVDDERVQYVGFEENRGANVARNAGIEAAEGRYIAFQDSDDRWCPRKLEQQVARMDSTSDEVGVVYTGWLRVSDENRTYRPSRDRAMRSGDIHDELLHGNFVTTPATLVRRECFEVAGRFDEQLPRLQDWELWLRISEHFEFELIDEPLVEKDVEADAVSISGDPDRYLDAMARILEKHRDRFNEAPEALSNHRFTLGHRYLLGGRSNEGRRRLAQAARGNPCVLYVLAGVISLLGSAPYRTLRQLYIEFKRLLR